MRLSWIHLSEKVQTFCRTFMNRFHRQFSRNRPDGMFIQQQIHHQGRRTRRTEACVVCRIDTRVPRELDISERLFYIEGAGQHCHDCYNTLYSD